MILNWNPGSNSYNQRVLIINITGKVNLSLDKIDDLKHEHIPSFDIICTSSHPYLSKNNSPEETNKISLHNSNDNDNTSDAIERHLTKENNILPVNRVTSDNNSAYVVITKPSFLASLIAEKYHYYDGFVVIHVTDNMAYTASALSFMLTNLGKPIIFTGYRISVENVHSDLNRNLVLSVLLAASTTINEVMILFAEELFRANRTTMISSVSLQPFATPNFPPLARGPGLGLGLGTNMIKKKNSMNHRLRKTIRSPLTVHPTLYENILVLKITPLISGTIILNLIRETTVKGIILCGFGTGNLPHAINVAAEEARRRDIIVVICSQVRYGWIDLSSYEPGRKLMKTGVVSAGDMTIEATTAKLAYLLDLGLTVDDVRKLLITDLKGEITKVRSNL